MISLKNLMISPIAKKPINFIEQFEDSQDKIFITQTIGEKIDREGYPCIHAWKPDDILDTDPLYNDSHTLYLDKYESRETYILIDYQHFSYVTRSEGTVIAPSSTLPAMMKMDKENEPAKNEYIILKRQFEGLNKFIFKITDCNNWKDVVWQISMEPAVFDNLSTGGIILRV